ncbi:Amino acid transporter AVT6A [Linum perenne]
MTIGNTSPNRGRKSKKGKQVDENAPLLPHRNQEGGFDEFNGASFPGAVFNLSTTIVGAGIMALPATMKVLGLVLGIAMIIFMAFLTDASIELLLRFSRVGKSTSYGGLMGDAFGKVGKILLQVAVMINNIGVLIVYMIIIDSLRYTSALSVALAVVFIVITMGITIIKLFNGSIMMPRLLPDVTDLGSFWNLFTVVPVLVTAYICHYNVHSIDNELKDPTQIKPVVRTSLALCSSVYIMTSVFGFLLFGDSTLEDVLANFNTDLGIPYSSFLNDAVRVSYAAHLMLVFPIVFHPLRLNMDGLLFPSSRPLYQDNFRFASITIGLISVIFLGSNFIPSIWDAFQFTGATAAVCLGFIFPASITLKDRHYIATSKDKMLCVFMIVLAVVSNAVAIYSDAYALMKKNSSSNVA